MLIINVMYLTGEDESSISRELADNGKHSKAAMLNLSLSHPVEVCIHVWG